MPRSTHSVLRPKAHCERCGAVARTSGPVVDMEPPVASGSTTPVVFSPCDGINHTTGCGCFVRRRPGNSTLES